MAVPDVSALLNEQTIALDALTGLIHVSNPVRSISIAQFGDILSGNSTNWAEIGGKDEEINVHVLGPDSNLTHIIIRDILAPHGLRMLDNAPVHQSLEELNLAVADDPHGFTLSYRSDSFRTRVVAPTRHVEDTPEEGEAEEHDETIIHGTIIPSTRNVCNIFSSPDTFSLQTEEYPLTMRWHLYSLKNVVNPDYAGRFAEYLQSDQGQEAAEDAGLVGLAIAQRPMRDQGERLLSAILADTVSTAGIRTYQDYLKEVSTGFRLSATMRFLTGTSQLDARSMQDWARVSRLVSSGLLDGRNIVLAGFSELGW